MSNAILDIAVVVALIILIMLNACSAEYHQVEHRSVIEVER